MAGRFRSVSQNPDSQNPVLQKFISSFAESCFAEPSAKQDSANQESENSRFFSCFAESIFLNFFTWFAENIFFFLVFFLFCRKHFKNIFSCFAEEIFKTYYGSTEFCSQMMSKSYDSFDVKLSLKSFSTFFSIISRWPCCGIFIIHSCQVSQSMWY